MEHISLQYRLLKERISILTERNYSHFSIFGHENIEILCWWQEKDSFIWHDGEDKWAWNTNGFVDRMNIEWELINTYMLRCADPNWKWKECENHSWWFIQFNFSFYYISFTSIGSFKILMRRAHTRVFCCCPMPEDKWIRKMIVHLDFYFSPCLSSVCVCLFSFLALATCDEWKMGRLDNEKG